MALVALKCGTRGTTMWHGGTFDIKMWPSRNQIVIICLKIEELGFKYLQFCSQPILNLSSKPVHEYEDLVLTQKTATYIESATKT